MRTYVGSYNLKFLESALGNWAADNTGLAFRWTGMNAAAVRDFVHWCRLEHGRKS